MVGAHRAAGDAVEHLALRLRAERILDDGREDVRKAADVGREVVPDVRRSQYSGRLLRRVVDAVGDLDRRPTGRPCGLSSACPRMLGQNGHVGLGLDRGADAEEAAAVVEVALERGLLRVAKKAVAAVSRNTTARYLARFVAVN